MDETVGKKTAAGMQKNGIHRMKVADTVSRLTMQSECLRMVIKAIIRRMLFGKANIIKNSIE